jgi:hypothetical protein
VSNGLWERWEKGTINDYTFPLCGRKLQRRTSTLLADKRVGLFLFLYGDLVRVIVKLHRLNLLMREDLDELMFLANTGLYRIPKES